MSHAIHKIVSKNAANRISLRGVRRIGKSKDSDLCASAHRCPHYAYARGSLLALHYKMKEDLQRL